MQGGKKRSNRIIELQPAINAAERQGCAFADAAHDFISEDETGLDSFLEFFIAQLMI